MIKLRKLISENIAIGKFKNDDIIIGTLDFNRQDIRSIPTSNDDITHRSLGYNALNWRYNQFTQTVYWWIFDVVGDYEKNAVKNHLKQTYGLDVVDNKPMRVTRKDITAKTKDEAEAEWIEKRKQRNTETHPFSWVAPLYNKSL